MNEIIKGINLNLYEVMTNRLQRVKSGHFVFSVWRGKTAYKDDVIKCYHMHYDKDKNLFVFENLKPLWIEKKNLKLSRELTTEEIYLLDKNNLLRDTAINILVYGKFQKESEKAVLIKFANEIDIWVAKSQIHNQKVYDLRDKEDICFEIPKWIAEDKLGKEVTNKFADAKDLISQRLSTLTTKFNLGGLNV